MHFFFNFFLDCILKVLKFQIGSEEISVFASFGKFCSSQLNRDSSSFSFDRMRKRSKSHTLSCMTEKRQKLGKHSRFVASVLDQKV